jgi:hypothetical protein
MSSADLDKATWARADNRFFWNRHIQEHLIAAAEQNSAVSNFILPIIVGCTPPCAFSPSSLFSSQCISP